MKHPVFVRQGPATLPDGTRVWVHEEYFGRLPQIVVRSSGLQYAIVENEADEAYWARHGIEVTDIDADELAEWRFG